MEWMDGTWMKGDDITSANRAEPDPAWFRWELARDGSDSELRGIDQQYTRYCNSPIVYLVKCLLDRVMGPWVLSLVWSLL